MYTSLMLRELPTRLRQPASGQQQGWLLQGWPTGSCCKQVRCRQPGGLTNRQSGWASGPAGCRERERERERAAAGHSAEAAQPRTSSRTECSTGLV